MTKEKQSKHIAPNLKSNKIHKLKVPILWFLLIASALVGVLLLTWLNIPNKQPLSTPQQEKFSQDIIITGTNKLIIPKISVNSEIYEGDLSVLKKGTWHRYPSNGNPEKGGNFILAAHRYIFSMDPRRVMRESVLYNIDKLDVYDTIYIDWGGKRYTYRINKKYLVRPDATQIEAPTQNAKLTLYSCTKKGNLDGREVIEATMTTEPNL